MNVWIYQICVWSVSKILEKISTSCVWPTVTGGSELMSVIMPHQVRRFIKCHQELLIKSDCNICTHILKFAAAVLPQNFKKPDDVGTVMRLLWTVIACGMCRFHSLTLVLYGIQNFSQELVEIPVFVKKTLLAYH